MHCWPGKMRWLSMYLSMWFASIVLLADPRVAAFAQAAGTAPEKTPTLRTAQAALVTVPNVIGQPAAKAWSLLSRQGLNSRVAGQASTSNQAQQDRVAGQSPPPGQRVDRGTVVSVTLYHFAGAPGQVTVPNVVGQPAGDAQSLLSRQGLGSRVAGQASTSNQAQQDRVASQSPPPGQRVNRGTVVSVTLYHFAGEPGQVTVPSVVGQPASNAQGILSGQGLVPRVAGQENTANPAQNGRVARQTPAPNTRIDRGTVVNLTVFRFAQPPAGTQPAAGGLTAPSVVNQPYPQAGQILSQVRLNIRVAGYRETRDPALNYRVAAQVPAAGAPVSVGSTVEVTLYEVRLSSISALYRGKGGDVVGPGSQATPDGKMDGHFSLTFDTGGVPRVVKYLLLEAVDAQGNRIFAAGGWDTSPGGTNRILGVYRSNRRLNPRDQAISDPVQGRVAYEVYGHDSGHFRPGQNFRLTVEFTDRGKASAFARVGSR